MEGGGWKVEGGDFRVECLAPPLLPLLLDCSYLTLSDPVNHPKILRQQRDQTLPRYQHTLGRVSVGLCDKWRRARG